MSNALRKIARSSYHIPATDPLIKKKKAKVFLYKGKEKDHAICQFHIRAVGAELANKLDKKIVGDMGTRAELVRIGRTELNCEICANDN